MSNVTCLDTFRAARLAPVVMPVAKANDAEAVRMVAVKAGHWTGSKFDHDRSIVEIAKLVRADIKAAIASGAIPALKVSVRVSKYSMGQSLNVTVTGIPASLRIVRVAAVRADVTNGQPVRRLTTEARAIVDAIEAIVSAYGYDKSDSQTDYHNVAFHSSVDFDGAIVNAQTREIEAMLTAAYSVAPGAPSAVA